MPPCLASLLMGCTAEGGPCSRCRLADPPAALVSLCMQMTSALWQAAHSICKHCWARRVLLPMEIGIPKAKIIQVSSVVQTRHAFTCNGCDTQQVGYKLTLLATLLIPLHMPRLPALKGAVQQSCSAMTQSIHIDAVPKHCHSCCISWM